MADTIKAGDIVKGNSHKYKMTVCEISEGKALCHYFDDKKQLHEEHHNVSDLSIMFTAISPE